MSLETATSVVRDDEWPLGLKFKPTKEELILILQKKIAKEKMKYEKIIVIDDFYSNTPDHHFANKEFCYKNKFVVLTNRKPNSKGAIDRHLPSNFASSWEPHGDLHAVLSSHDDTFLGVYQMYYLCSYGNLTEGKAPTPSPWFMQEFQTTDPNCPLSISVVSKLHDPAASYKTHTSAQKSLRRAKKTRFLAHYKALQAAKLAEAADKSLETAQTLYQDALKNTQQASMKQKDQERLLLTSNLSAVKRKTDQDAGPSNQQPPRPIKFRFICSKSGAPANQRNA